MRHCSAKIGDVRTDNPGIDVHWIGEAPCVAVVASGDPLARKKSVKATDLNGRRLIASANPYRLRWRINEVLKEHDVTPEGIVDNNATYVSLALARAGLGVAIVESVTLLGLPIVGVEVIPLSFRVPFYWGVITATGRPLSRTTERFIGAIEKNSRRLSGFRKHSDTSSIS